MLQTNQVERAGNPIAPGTGGTPVSQGNVTEPQSPDPAPPASTLVYLTPVGEFIHSADAKAATILTVLGIMFTLLARFGAWLDGMIRSDHRALVILTLALLALFATASLGAVIQSFRTISPRFPEATPSLAFFGDIARLTPDEYLRRTSGLGAGQALDERLKYNHTGSRIILLKFAQLRWALRLFATAAVCWLLLVG